MTEWIDRSAALNLLGVKPQTLYAYVSRRMVQMQPDPLHPRRSLYCAEDVAALSQRRARGRKPAVIAASSLSWGEPSIVTGISTILHGRLIYRGQDAVEFSMTATLEDAATLLWSASAGTVFDVPNASFSSPFQALATIIQQSQASIGRGRERLCRDAQLAVGYIAAGCAVASTDQPLHLGLAKSWTLGEDDTDLIRQALVLIADHELNASTFAARIAASTGAPIAACLNAGLSTLSGPLHGGAGPALMRLLTEASSMGAARSIQNWLDRYRSLPGFGHPLYPSGDRRALALLNRVETDPLLRDLQACMLDMTGLLPNIDFALTALARTLSLPSDAPFTLFLLGRSVGWAAHAMEQVLTGTLIRPRARYEGVLPE